MPATEGLSNVVLYTTEAFNLGHQIRAVQSTDGFLGDTLGGNEAVEDPLWSGHIEEPGKNCHPYGLARA